MYRIRTRGDIDALDLESYRNESKHWRDEITIQLLGRKCTSSARFQDDLFNENAIPPKILKILSDEIKKTAARLRLTFIKNFSLEKFINSFWNEQGLKRSLDKIYEIVVYALFSALAESLQIKIEISVDEKNFDILREFEDFSKKVMNLNILNPVYIQDAKIFRVGVTNAADRGIDMYANWGAAIQIKHLSLDENLAENIVENISNNKIIIVCKDAEQKIILSLLTQIGWRSRIQSIVTEKNLIDWYEKALRGKFSNIIGNKLMENICAEIAEEFPSVEDLPKILKIRHYEKISDTFWN